MITQVRSHDDYIAFVSNQINLLYPNNKLIRGHFFDLVIWVCITDLTQTADLLKHRYSSNPRGRKPRNPSDMLRSLLLMQKLQYTSIDKWVEALRTIPLYAVLSGFDPNSTPGVGTFYDFLNRLWLAPSPHLMKKKGKKNQKVEPKNPGIVERLVRHALRQRKVHYSSKAHDGLQQLFQSMFGEHSASQGLLGDLESLSILGDGTPVETGGRPYGKLLCDCRRRGNWKCDCLRQFSDPDANYGWDSSREKYYYGRNLFMVSASDSPYDLPIYPRLYRASKHDSVLFVSTYHELLHWYPEWRIGESILDSTFDAYPIYEMLEQYDVSAIIVLNPRRSKQFTYKEMDINLDGVPVCPLGREMINWGIDKERYRRKCHCPAVVGKWECPNPCSGSSYGRTFHTSTRDNPRLFPRVKRDSKEWYKRYALRTGAERCIKRQKIDYKLEESKGRSSRHWNIRTYIIAMCQHADAWVKELHKYQFAGLNTKVKSILII